MTSDDELYAAQAAVSIAATNFADAFWVDQDMDAAWVRTDPLLRRCWAQAWLLPLRAQAEADGFDPDQVVEAFTADAPDHPLWTPFARGQINRQEIVVERGTWGVKVNPELVAPDIQLLRYLPVPASGAIQPGETYAAVPLLMRYEPGPGWRLLNFVSETIPEPGWPPAL
ncbi:hypothetical protein ACWEQP_13695 [Streptomyces sp. NPDC004044]